MTGERDEVRYSEVTQRYSPWRAPVEPLRAPEQEHRALTQFAVDPQEVFLSKGDAADLAKAKLSGEFTRRLGAWAESRGTRGYTIDPVPDEGPGTMRWRAVR